MDSCPSSFLSIMQVHPGLDIITIAKTRFFLRLSKFLTCFVSPATLSKKCIPNGNFLIARSPALAEAPFEDFFIRAALQRSPHKVVVIHSEKSRATRIEVGRILDTGEILRRQFARGL